MTDKHITTRNSNRYVAWTAIVTMAMLVAPLPCQGFPVASGDGDLKKQEKGDWYTPPLPLLEDRMQSVHTILLPNGKVLMVNGSSNRNRIEGNQILDGVDVKDHMTVNNSAIFDPDAQLGTHGVTRIASPDTPDKDGDSTDLFCSGHIHLWNGNVLFVSGTRGYYPPESFRGHKNAVVFDWKTEVGTQPAS